MRPHELQNFKRISGSCICITEILSSQIIISQKPESLQFLGAKETSRLQKNEDTSYKV